VERRSASAEGIVWCFRNGFDGVIRLKIDVYQSVWERHRPGPTSRTHIKTFAAVKANACYEGHQLVVGLVSLDSTSIRTQQHAAGARSTTTPILLRSCPGFDPRSEPSPRRMLCPSLAAAFVHRTADGTRRIR